MAHADESMQKIAYDDDMGEPLDDTSLQQLFIWLDKIPLSRPKRNVTRDFSDGGNCSYCLQCF